MTTGRATALAAAAFGVALLLATQPWGHAEAHQVRLGLAVVGLGALAARVWLAERYAPWVRGLLVLAVVLGTVNYWRRSPAAFAGVDDFSDVTFYYLNSKYLDELGHYGFYPAMIVADLETADRHASRIEKYRDLRTDEIAPVSVARAHGREVKARFTPERWAQFAHDNDFFQSRQKLPEIAYIYVDHGYNPPPSWSIVGGTLSSLVPVEHLKLLTAVDIPLVVAAFAAVGVTFGGEALLWALLFFTVTFSGRWPILGHAVLRFDWLCALIGGTCALARGRYGLAGGLMGYAAASRVFPAIFLGAWLWEAIGDTWRTGRIAPRHARFAAAAVAVVGGLAALALARYGVDICREGVENLAMHGRSFSSHRLGAGVVATWRGEFTREAMKAMGGMAAREQLVRSLQPLLVALSAASVLGFAAIAVRRRWPAWEVVPWMSIPLFLATNPQVNYWNLRVLPVIWHAAGLRGPHRRFHALGIALLLAAEVAAHAVHLAGYERHAVHAMGAWGFAAWSVASIAWIYRQGMPMTASAAPSP